MSAGFQTLEFGAHPREAKGFKTLLTKATQIQLSHRLSPSVLLVMPEQSLCTILWCGAPFISYQAVLCLFWGVGMHIFCFNLYFVFLKGEVFTDLLNLEPTWCYASHL